MARDSKVLLTTRAGETWILTLNRPDAGNSMSQDLAAALHAAVAAVRKDRDAKAVVLTGAGERFFCTGGDLKEYRHLTTRSQLMAVFGRMRKLLDELENLPVPVIAAVNGLALGGGAELLLACDIRVAIATAQIGFTQVRLGLLPAWNGAERLVRTSGRAAATRLLVTGDIVSARDAQTLGLIDVVVTEKTAVDAAVQLAARLDDVGPLAVVANKRAVLDAVRLPTARVRRRAAKTFETLWFSPDHREAESAFVEKRRPVFRGR
jgi:enoyl-CoA hydratase/carnithine racemase